MKIKTASDLSPATNTWKITVQYFNKGQLEFTYKVNYHLKARANNNMKSLRVEHQ